MSKSLKLAAIAAAMVVGSTSVYATGGGLTAAQVRKIVVQEVAKVRQGPRGKPGMDGLPSLFAHVFGTGVVNDMLPGGITQENVELVETPGDNGTINFTYCFSGLPPVTSGQIALDGLGNADIATPYIQFTDDPMCSPRVHISGSGGPNTAAGFHILLY